MKKLFIILLLFLGCRKAETITDTVLIRELCSFGLSPSEMNIGFPELDEQATGINRKYAIKMHVQIGKPVIYLDFDGDIIKKTIWGDSLVLDESSLSITQMQSVVNNFVLAFSKFNVIITTSEYQYLLGNKFKRIRVIFTTTNFYAPVGGTAFVNSFGWGNDTPCFVFTKSLNFNIKYIKEAAVHEVGHTLGLRHQAVVDSNCVLISEYNYGTKYFAPLMGVAYYSESSGWIVGKTPFCQVQDDVKAISYYLRPKK